LLRKICVSALIVAVAAFVAAGCGGDDDEDTTTDPATTATEPAGTTGPADVSPERAALIEEADDICLQGDQEIDREAGQFFGDTQQEPPVSEQAEFIEDVVVPNIQDQLDQLRELEPPTDDAEEFNSIIDNAQEALDEVADDPEALTGQGADPFAEVNRQAQEFGLTACGS
jgi:hypothetical protein